MSATVNRSRSADRPAAHSVRMICPKLAHRKTVPLVAPLPCQTRHETRGRINCFCTLITPDPKGHDRWSQTHRRLDGDAPSSGGVTAGKRIGARLVNVDPPRTEALDHALDTLDGIDRCDRVTIGTAADRLRETQAATCLRRRQA